MSSSRLRLRIEAGKFCDANGRQVVLRGINVAGDAKYPNCPDQPSHVGDSFFDGDKVRFTAKPFSKDEAHVHFARLRRLGYNTVRYIFTWEAIEAAGPGIYDEEWIQHTIDVLRVAKQYGFYVFMDPHQDVWSRFSGGSGAPMWTLYACGLNPKTFAVTEAAIVHNTYPDPEAFPKMIWSTNYQRLAASTIFTLFFAGRDFAPRCIIDGVNIQDYLQGHFLRACHHLARRMHEAGGIENDVVFGWETLNEPNRGLIGYQDISVIPAEQALKKGTCPTVWQTMLTGLGRAVEVDTWDMGGLGPTKTGKSLVDPAGETAWLPGDYDDSRYGWKRGPEWKLGQCVWAQHGVWEPETDTLLRKDYFGKHPTTGETVDSAYFGNRYLMEFVRPYRDGIRQYHKEAMLFLQGATMELPPMIRGTPDGDDPNLVYAPHWYDGITLMTKKWNRAWNLDIIGVLRGRYWHPALAVKVGETAIRNCFRDQLATIRQEGVDYLGDGHPCMMTEFGIPYDMDNKYAYKTGDYASQSAAMDANHFGVETSGMEGYSLWCYSAKNDHRWGDQWNGEDLSIFSVDDSPLPVSALPKTTEFSSKFKQGLVLEVVDDDSAVTPTNLQRVLTSPSISTPATTTTTTTTTAATSPATATPGSLRSSPSSPELTSTPGYRGAEAYVRPHPLAVAGRVEHYVFDLRRCEFSMRIAAPRAVSADDAPTVVFLPEYHFPRGGGGDGAGAVVSIDVSSGRWEIDEEGPDEAAAGAREGGAEGERVGDQHGRVGEMGVMLAPMQRLRWWHGEGEQTIRVIGVTRKHNIGDKADDGAGYYDQCNNSGWGSSCVAM